MGNSVKCYECRYYSEKQEGDKNKMSGWCHNKKHIKDGCAKPSDKIRVHKNWRCTWWEDAQDGWTRFEIETRTPEPTRTEIEKMFFAEMMREVGE